jgi:hypothetical protein
MTTGCGPDVEGMYAVVAYESVGEVICSVAIVTDAVPSLP